MLFVFIPSVCESHFSSFIYVSNAKALTMSAYIFAKRAFLCVKTEALTGLVRPFHKVVGTHYQ